MKRPFEKVIVVGAGPSGLLAALLLRKHGIPVRVLEASDELDKQPRAAHYGPPAVPDLDRAGVLGEARRRGLTLNTMCWRRLEDHSLIAGFDCEVLKDCTFDSGTADREAQGGGGVRGHTKDLRTTCLVLQDLDKLMLDMFLEAGGEVSWKHQVVDVGQDGDEAWVDVLVGDEKKKERIGGNYYILGCDGANSQVRKSLFGQEYPGWTWDAQIVATNTYYPFEEKFGFHDANFIIHPEHFYMAARITADGLYRVTYGETPGLTLEQMKERLPMKFEIMLPGHPKPGEYEVVNFAPYKMHQRCAPAFRKGRFLLAADAAHLCNPWGGLGITGGFVDVGGLYDCLAGLWDGVADEAILDLYSEKRVAAWKTIIDPISQENFRRVSDPDPASRLGRDEWMQLLEKGKDDVDFTRQLLMGFMDVRYDFTQHYTKPAAPAARDAADAVKSGVGASVTAVEASGA